MNNSENRFSNRVDNYVKYRPTYPDQIVSFLEGEGILKPNALIADIGSGTGISTELFLKHQYSVCAVEPNEPMRLAAEKICSSYEGFKSVGASAEQTTLDNNSVDLIVAAQAFHWFDKERFKQECKRILKPDGVVALIWNDRQTNMTDFLKSYEDFLQMFAIDYKLVNHKNIQSQEVFDAFYGEGNCKNTVIQNHQYLDFEGLKGRVLSSSYMPDEQHADYTFMIYCLKKIFLRYQENGKVRLDYDTRVFYGKPI